MINGRAATKVALSPLTGRRHQLRVHLASVRTCTSLLFFVVHPITNVLSAHRVPQIVGSSNRR
jgi:hypothetical protein